MRKMSLKIPRFLMDKRIFPMVNVCGVPIHRSFCNQSESKELTQDLFKTSENKNKETYLDLIRIFVNKNYVYRRGHVQFIYTALKEMETFGVQKDLEAYKSLIDVLPKGKFIPTNMMQVEFMHYPKQQQCIIDLLEQMEDNGVMPDYDMEELLKNIFGNKGYPLRKYWRMMYWMPKFKHASPWPLPRDLPNDLQELTKLAIQRISSVDVQTKVSTYLSKDLEDSVDDTWIISAQSPEQQELLKMHKIENPVYVEGPFRVWLKNAQISYFVLRDNAKEYKVDYETDDVSHLKIPSLFNIKPFVKDAIQKVPSVHEQENGTILAVCATGTSSKDSLLSWIRHLEKDGNEVLSDIPVVFTLRSSPQEIVPVSQDESESKPGYLKE